MDKQAVMVDHTDTDARAELAATKKELAEAEKKKSLAEDQADLAADDATDLRAELAATNKHLREAEKKLAELAETGKTQPGGTSQTTPRKLCFKEKSSRRKQLRGTWPERSFDRKASFDSQLPYYNLSCYYISSKMDCFFHDNIEHAINASLFEFVPDECELQDVSADMITNVVANTTVFMVGDSLIRQIWVAMACLFDAHVVERYVPWAECGVKDWPCNRETTRCIKCGVHSGFGPAWMKLENNVTFIFPLYDIAAVLRINKPKAGDIIILESGVHGKTGEVTTTAIEAIKKEMADGEDKKKWIWLVTPEQHFNTPNGEYDNDYLKKAHREHAAVLCPSNVPPYRQEEEIALLKEHNLLTKLDGLISATGMETLGKAKVGDGVGTFGDCTHFCMPGIPDQLSRLVLNMLYQVASD